MNDDFISQIPPDKRHFFTNNILKWAEIERRPMPWKFEKDPYKIWLSEIILQQTQVEQGKSYYLKFCKKYPDVETLANTPLDNVLNDWQGLGYNSRARNLLDTAQTIVKTYNGKFPQHFDEIVALKGIGDYTASAIASFAYNHPHAVVDSNVVRILSRFFGIERLYLSSSTKKMYQNLANDLLKLSKPAKYNQAIMDFGAIMCKPKSPLCPDCPLNEKCTAFLENKTDALPLKHKKITKRIRYFYYFVISNSKGVFLKKRTENDIWKDMYDFPLIESEKKLNEKNLLELIRKSPHLNCLLECKIEKNLDYKQELTHRKIYSTFYTASSERESFIRVPEMFFVEYISLKNYPFPRTISWYFEKNDLSLF